MNTIPVVRAAGQLVKVSFMMLLSLAVLVGTTYKKYVENPVLLRQG